MPNTEQKIPITGRGETFTIISDGTACGTRILMNGEELQGVQALKFEGNLDNPLCTLTLTLVPELVNFEVLDPIVKVETHSFTEPSALSQMMEMDRINIDRYNPLYAAKERRNRQRLTIQEDYLHFVSEEEPERFSEPEIGTLDPEPPAPSEE